jgi:hypothetical protein
MLHHEQETLEDRARRACERPFLPDVEKLASDLEALVQRPRRGVGPRRKPRL